MIDFHTNSIIGFHSCDKQVGLRVLNGEDKLNPSTNNWDWLGWGVYFWEQDPLRALEYATECANQKQFNRVRIRTPFVIGALIDLKNCLNLVESSSLKVLGPAYRACREKTEEKGKNMPVNNGNNRALDCYVIESIHEFNLTRKEQPYDTVRCAFPEGEAVYPNSFITSRLHIQVCVRNIDCIKGFFLPQPVYKFNPYLQMRA